MNSRLTFAEQEQRLRDIFDHTSEVYKADQLLAEREEQRKQSGIVTFLAGPTAHKVGDSFTSKGVEYEVVAVNGGMFDAIESLKSKQSKPKVVGPWV